MIKYKIFFAIALIFIINIFAAEDIANANTALIIAAKEYNLDAVCDAF